jgi:hypothetical protein
MGVCCVWGDVLAHVLMVGCARAAVFRSPFTAPGSNVILWPVSKQQGCSVGCIGGMYVWTPVSGVLGFAAPCVQGCQLSSQAVTCTQTARRGCWLA